ncbi:MAG: NERD domain-containing protein [Actinomycetota bacterium]|nr:NERD domain-containing protein [Actinomycetota bacterium]
MGTLLSVVTEPSHQRVWARGAHGERLVAKRLAAQLAGTDVVLLHDRRLPHGRANFDHIAVGPAGVLVIDTKNLRGAVRRRGHGSRQRLRVGDHDRTSLVISAHRQARSLRRVLAAEGFGHVPVHAALCLARPQSLGWRSSTSVRGVLVGSPERVARRARKRGGLSSERVYELASVIGRQLPHA